MMRRGGHVVEDKTYFLYRNNQENAFDKSLSCISQQSTIFKVSLYESYCTEFRPIIPSLPEVWFTLTCILNEKGLDMFYKYSLRKGMIEV